MLKRSCPKLSKVAVRRFLYFVIVKPHLCYATEVWSPALHKSQKITIEQVQRRAARWILSLKTRQISYGERLLALDMLPLYCHYHCHIDIDVSNYVTFNKHPSTRRGQSPGCYLTVPACKTCTF